MKRVGVILMVVIAGLALLAFGGGICLAAVYTFWIHGAPRPDDMPGIVSYFVSAVNGTLAANLGVLLGISISLRGWRGPKNTTEKFQWIAAIWYVVMLVVATVFWGLAGFTDDASKVVSLLPEMTKNAIGIFVAILAGVLGVQSALTQVKAVEDEANKRGQSESG